MTVGACPTSGGVQALRKFAAWRSSPRWSTPSRNTLPRWPCHRRLSIAGLSDRSRPTAGHAQRAAGRTQARAAAIVVDAATGPAASVGRIRRWEAPELETTIALSSHGLGLAQTFALGRALDRVPDRLVLFTVDVTDTTPGTGLTPQAAAAASRLVDLIVAEFTQTDGLTPSRREPARSSRAGRQPTGEETWRPAQSNRLPR